jgi:hypothetical protein
VVDGVPDGFGEVAVPARLAEHEAQEDLRFGRGRVEPGNRDVVGENRGMSYSFTPTGYYATFDRKQSRGGIVQRPVEAWSADGDALVVDNKVGQLVPVRNLPGFEGLQPCRQQTAVLPALPGWSVHHTPEGEDSATYPVVGWLITSDGTGLPLVAAGGGAWTSEELDDPDQCVLLAPGEKPSPPSSR